MNTVFSALYTRVIRPIKARLRLEDGLEAVEYALIAALLSVVIITAIGFFTPALEDLFEAIGDLLADQAAEVVAPEPAP